jgi:hypothetical protein
MKQMVGAIMLLLAVSIAAHAASYLNVYYNGSKDKISGIDLRSMTVCELKSQLASRYSLKMRDFDLKAGARVLNDGGTLADVHVNQSTNLTVLPKSTNSRQCT